ncbi:WxcM-like domain-containing protein [Bacillus luteolus]|uniref:WxcM-like domain-containing protein n=1 Tax=Litchfieldia luteola TaxID=682179 RepID=A0ABR9QG63_9BACI|nr:FdtA/QdtA family cupin domain-containing protein [Cytobacillus luteolus]MBE4907229.1 WxcM-like domain-containing protein [Cytobacillus luteolus]MBP1943295.1 dTDP-4-dehydrorhamnose 3,5-epimerase-like enzyme [Cytobacillus luteolus]
MKNLLIEFQIIADKRGGLVSLEQFKNIPFDIKRVYYIFDTKPDEERGFHAHKNLQQVLICLNGSCKVRLDDGTNKREYYLSKPNQGLLIEKSIWREMYDFTEGCVLLVLASDYYDENDYIRNYEEFKRK